MTSQIETIDKEIAEANEALTRVMEELKACKAMLDRAKRGELDLQTVVRLQDRKADDELNIRTTIGRLESLRQKYFQEATSLSSLDIRSGQPRSSFASSKATIGAARTQSRQLTLRNFVFRITNEKEIRSIDAPEFATGLSLECEGCRKTFKSREGHNEHRRHCGEFKQITEQRLRDVAELKRQKRSDDAAHQRATQLHSDQVEGAIDLDESENSDAETQRSPVKEKGRRGQEFRKSYTLQTKLRVVNLCEGLEADGLDAPNRRVADLTNIAESNIAKWRKKRYELRKQLFNSSGGKGRGNVTTLAWRLSRGPKPKFAAAEQIVFERFLSARSNGIRVGPTLITTWMRKAVTELYPSVLSSCFRASGGWRQRFVARYGLTCRRATNRKEMSLQERLPKVQRWHKRWHYTVSAGVGGDPTFGRYLPQNVLNSDQVPIRGSEMLNTTYERQGAATVRIAQQKGSDKRMATLQICVSLDGSPAHSLPQPKIAIIFKGKGNVTPQEREQYDPRVDVYFQPKAWMDSDLFEAWVERTVRPFVASLPSGPKVMILDNLRAQTMQSSLEALRSIGLERRLLPENTTDMIQPVDQNVGVDVKRRVGEKLNHRLAEDEVFANQWLGVEGSFSASQRRILMTNLVGEAWTEFCAAKDFRELGLTTGCVMVRTGVDRATVGLSPIKIKGLPDYSFEHVALGDPVPELDFDPLEEDVEDPIAASPAQQASSVASSAPRPSRDPLADRLGRERSSTDEEAPAIFEANDAVESPSGEPYYDEDENTEDTLIDDTDQVPPPESIDPPEGYVFEEVPEELPPISNWIGKKVFWRAEMPDGTPLSWIITELIGGPADPREALSGVTMRLKCDKRRDPNTPAFFRTKVSSVVQVALTRLNHGRKWFLLNTVE